MAKISITIIYRFIKNYDLSFIIIRSMTVKRERGENSSLQHSAKNLLNRELISEFIAAFFEKWEKRWNI